MVCIFYVKARNTRARRGIYEPPSSCALVRPIVDLLCLLCPQVNPDIIFEVFIHKVDGLSDDHKIGMQRYLFSVIMDKRHFEMDEFPRGIFIYSYQASVFITGTF